MGASQTCQLETPTTTEDYLTLSEKVVSQMTDWLNSNNWNSFHNTDKVTLESRPMDESQIDAQKGTVILTGSDFDGLANKLFNPTFEERKKVYDEVLLEKVLHVINENNIVVQTQFSAPWPVVPREFVVLKTRTILGDDSQLITAHSINYPDLPPSSGCVRGIVRTGMLVTNLGNNQIKVTKVEHVDPQGMIPTEIVQAKQRKNAHRLDAMKGYLE
jgi:hypothetical protein